MDSSKPTTTLNSCSFILVPLFNSFFFSRVHQTHYEQFGKITGTATIDGRPHGLSVDVVRDHTYGTREWRTFHRYALHFFTAENGDRFAVMVISMPVCFSSLTIGYVYEKSTNQIVAVRWCDLELHQQGETPPPPRDFGFSFGAGEKRIPLSVLLKS